MRQVHAAPPGGSSLCADETVTIEELLGGINWRARHGAGSAGKPAGQDEEGEHGSEGDDSGADQRPRLRPATKARSIAATIAAHPRRRLPRDLEGGRRGLACGGEGRCRQARTIQEPGQTRTVDR